MKSIHYCKRSILPPRSRARILQWMQSNEIQDVTHRPWKSLCTPSWIPIWSDGPLRMEDRCDRKRKQDSWSRVSCTGMPGFSGQPHAIQASSRLKLLESHHSSTPFLIDFSRFAAGAAFTLHSTSGSADRSCYKRRQVHFISFSRSGKPWR